MMQPCRLYAAQLGRGAAEGLIAAGGSGSNELRLIRKATGQVSTRPQRRGQQGCMLPSTAQGRRLNSLGRRSQLPLPSLRPSTDDHAVILQVVGTLRHLDKGRCTIFVEPGSTIRLPFYWC